MTDGRTTIYNSITSQYKLDEVNPDNTQLEDDFLDYLSSLGILGNVHRHGMVIRCGHLFHH